MEKAVKNENNIKNITTALENAGIKDIEIYVDPEFVHGEWGVYSDRNNLIELQKISKLVEGVCK